MNRVIGGRRVIDVLCRWRFSPFGEGVASAVLPPRPSDVLCGHRMKDSRCTAPSRLERVYSQSMRRQLVLFACARSACRVPAAPALRSTGLGSRADPQRRHRPRDCRLLPSRARRARCSRARSSWCCRWTPRAGSTPRCARSSRTSSPRPFRWPLRGAERCARSERRDLPAVCEPCRRDGACHQPWRGYPGPDRRHAGRRPSPQGDQPRQEQEARRTKPEAGEERDAEPDG